MAKTLFGESFPDLWLFAMGLIFIGVVLGLPNGIAGLYATYVGPHVERLMDRVLGSAGKAPEQTDPTLSSQGVTP